MHFIRDGGGGGGGSNTTGVETRGEGETQVISILKLLVLHDTCDFSLLFFLGGGGGGRVAMLFI